MIIFSSKSNEIIDIWKNTIISNFTNNDEFVKIQYLSAVVDVFGFDNARKEQEYASKFILEFMENFSIKNIFIWKMFIEDGIMNGKVIKERLKNGIQSIFVKM